MSVMLELEKTEPLCSALSSSATSGEQQIEEDEWLRACHHFALPTSRMSLSERFAELADTWRGDKTFLSSLTEIVTLPSYQQIIGLGPDAVPLILDELRDVPDHWFWALSAITSLDPVLPEHCGDLDAMTGDWLLWSEAQSAA